MRRFRLISGSLVIAMVIMGIYVHNTYPILLKWMMGEARNLGKPIAAVVFTNGQVNTRIKVYRIGNYWYGGHANSYLLYLPEHDTAGMLAYVNVDLKDRWVGVPSATGEADYKVIGGSLFQSETGGHYSPFEDGIKGLNWQPQLVVGPNAFHFTFPPHVLPFDSIRVDLANH
jgi:hypothetical protein